MQLDRRSCKESSFCRILRHRFKYSASKREPGICTCATGRPESALRCKRKLALTRGLSALRSVFACQSTFERQASFLFVLRMNAQLMPRRFCEVDAVVLCSFLDIRERQGTLGIGNIDDLIEPGDRVTYMFCVG